MTAAALTSDAPRLDIGWVVMATLRVLRRRAGELALIALPFLWLPSVIAAFAPGNRALDLLSNLPGLVFTGGAALITYQELAGGLPVTAGQAIGEGVRKFGTLWLIAVMSGLATLLGLILLIVPGIIVGVGFCAASTVAMVEGKPSTQAMQRAWDLSRGQRWRLVGLVGILLLASLGVLLFGFATGMILGLTGNAGATDAVANFGVGPITGTLVAVATTVGTAAAYVGLRTAKEGPTEDIARTFE